ncbi:exopolyphosphatase [Iodobacter arcticus]|uniref:Exopolyphosphatase n=1 Tax=Iodobacter arcticus TaxID=590593 RepID=A0ABW2R2R5_9NEIS
MPDYPIIAAVDLGSNSFRLQIARVVEGALFPLDSLKETVRLGAGLDASGSLTPEAQQQALEALSRFGERLRGLPVECVRAVATNTFRVAKNASVFLPQAEAALGFPIEVIAGREEARLIYIGAAHSLPATRDKRLVVDIGGGSTELITGSHFRIFRTESVPMGCVSWSLRFFPDGIITAERLAEAELAARGMLLSLVPDFNHEQWQRAVGTSGTARSIADILELNDFSALGITREGMDKLRQHILAAGHVDKVQLNGLRSDRRPVLPGGFAIMMAVFDMLAVERMGVTFGALRDGVLYDLVGRQSEHDIRHRSVEQFQRRYHVDPYQAERVGILAGKLFSRMVADDTVGAHRLNMAASLHEVGRSIAHASYHKHSAYILLHADMPGFSKREQALLARLVLAHRGGLSKLNDEAIDLVEWSAILALRLATIFCRSRTDIDLPLLRCEANSKQFLLELDNAWLEANPLTAYALTEEVHAWQNIGMKLLVVS